MIVIVGKIKKKDFKNSIAERHTYAQFKINPT
jgi:hypothetical protein